MDRNPLPGDAQTRAHRMGLSRQVDEERVSPFMNHHHL